MVVESLEISLESLLLNLQLLQTLLYLLHNLRRAYALPQADELLRLLLLPELPHLVNIFLMIHKHRLFKLGAVVESVFLQDVVVQVEVEVQLGEVTLLQQVFKAYLFVQEATKGLD